MIHSYPWYIADWRGSEAVLSMTLAERGLYRELLDHCWECGNLPNSEVVLTKIAHCSEKEFRKSWPTVKAQFYENDGRLYHVKVNEKRRAIEEWHDGRREAGRKGGLAKKASLATSSAKAQPVADLKPSTSTSTSTSSVRHFDTVETCPDGAPRFTPPTHTQLVAQESAARMAALHPKPTNRVLIESALASAIDRGHTPALIESAHADWCASAEWTEDGGKWCPGLAKWMADDGFTKKPRKPAATAEVPQYFNLAEAREKDRKRKNGSS